MIAGFETTWCQTSDMDRSVAFYRDVLGLKPAVVSPYWSHFELEGGALGLHPPLEGAAPPYAVAKKGWVVGVRTPDVKALRERLVAAGADVDADYYELPQGTTITFRDPDGNPIQAVQLGVKKADL